MKKRWMQLKEKATPVILSIALLLTGMLSFDSIQSLEGNARVVNYIGIVRGGTQRLVKEELHRVPDDALIVRLDKILAGLSEGSAEFELIQLQSPAFQALLSEMKADWIQIKAEIARHRNGASGETLFQLSEAYFNLADRTVLAAEAYTEESVQSTRRTLLYMNLTLVLLAALNALSVYYQEKRREKLREAEAANQRKSERLSMLSREILVPMNEISELVYISDVNTYELLFANDAGKKTFHLDEKKGMKCYEALQGLDAPCPFCTMSRIKRDETYTWEHTNLLTKRHYLLKNRLVDWGGRLARLEIAFDITDAAKEKEKLQNSVACDQVLLECIREFYRNHDVTQATSYVLGLAGKLFSADRAYVFAFHGAYLSNTVEWCREGIEPQIDNLQNVPQADFSIWLDMFKKRENLLIDDLELLKEQQPLQYEFLAKQGIQRVLLVPLERDGKLSGLIGLDNLSRNLLENAAAFLQTLRYFYMLAMTRNEDEKKLALLSYHDTLTSFYNRNRYMQDIVALTKRRVSAGVAYLDVNGLKEINDHLGHDAGDRLLKECARMIQSVFTTADLYRIGGDEFVIICAGMGESEFGAIVRALRDAFGAGTCRAAIGAGWTENSEHIQSVIMAADQRMYADKKAFYQKHQASGRYRHQSGPYGYLSDPAILQEKIARGNFLVYLQPKIDVESRRAIGAEALVRYRDENGQIVSPDQFISILENALLIEQVDFYVFEAVCVKLKEWERRGKEIFPISCNFSRASFKAAAFIGHLEEICKKYAVKKEYLGIEITECVNDDDYRGLKDQIDRVRALGLSVSVDDFGMACSNLTQLSKPSFDVLKIDQSFVRDIMTNAEARTLVEAVVDVCKKMEIRLIVEGVEKEDQLAMILECGVRIVQGFLFRCPIPIEEFERRYLQ